MRNMLPAEGKGLIRLTRLSLEFILLVLATGIAGGCAHRAMDSAIASWQDQPVSAVVTAWGPPSEELRVSGKHLLLWNTHEGRPPLPEQKRSASRPVAPDCVRLLEVDGRDRIVAGAWEGNHCPGWFSGWRR